MAKLILDGVLTVRIGKAASFTLDVQVSTTDEHVALHSCESATMMLMGKVLSKVDAEFRLDDRSSGILHDNCDSTSGSGKTAAVRRFSETT